MSDEYSIAQLFRWGVYTYGGDHKQWCLIELAKKICPEILEDGQYEDGIAP